jgi:hypothetical protein
MTDDSRTLGEVDHLVRSKNAGPFWMTIDVFFATDTDYEQVAGALDEDTIARVYQTDPAGVALYRLPNIQVIKASFPRPVVQGSFAGRDIHAGQQHIPLAGLAISTIWER